MIKQSEIKQSESSISQKKADKRVLINTRVLTSQTDLKSAGATDIIRSCLEAADRRLWAGRQAEEA